MESVMPTRLDEVLDEALKLGPMERAELVEQILASFEFPAGRSTQHFPPRSGPLSSAVRYQKPDGSIILVFGPDHGIVLGISETIAFEVIFMRQFKVVVEKHPDTYVAYPLGLKGVVVGQGETYEAALADVKSAIQFHIETFGPETLEIDPPILEAFIAAAGVPV
jgi:predicted RNase H-like HicB family nuclease